MTASDGPTGDWLLPDWPAPPRVRALTTLRPATPVGAYRSGESFDLSRQARDGSAIAALLPEVPCWLRQVHGAGVVEASPANRGREADASWTDRPGCVCAVLTADCLPVLFCDRHGRRIAAAHAGWRGLAAGVLEATVMAMGGRTRDCLAWLGPAIGPRAFVVGPEVREAFVRHDARAGAAFAPAGDERWHADLPALARQRLAALGIAAVSGGGLCTHSDPDRFYSHRRDAGRTGRHATLIWIEPV